MNDTRYRIENLTLYDYRGVEQHLAAMAAKGWRLERIGAQLWKYRRSEPAKVCYAVTYIQDSSQFNPVPTERQLSLEELCAAAGWTKVTDWFQMQIYVSEAEHPVPLETEESVRLEAVHRSMKKNFLPCSVLILLYALVQLGLFFRTLVKNPLHILENNASLFTGPLLLLLTVQALFTLTNYWLWRRRSVKSVAQGSSCAPCGAYRWVNRLNWAFLFFWVALYLLWETFSTHLDRVVFFAVYMLLFCLLIFLARKFTALLRRCGVSRTANFLLTLLSIVVLSFAITGGLTYSVIHGRWFNGSQNETYIEQGEAWDAAPIPLPLTVSDLTGETYRHIRRRDDRTGSILLLQRSCQDTVRAAETEAHSQAIYYTVTAPHSRFYHLILDLTLRPREETISFRTAHFSWVYTWAEVPAAPWGAKAAYQKYLDGDPLKTYLLCFPDRIVEFDANWDLTPEQMATVGERLKTT